MNEQISTYCNNLQPNFLCFIQIFSSQIVANRINKIIAAGKNNDEMPSVIQCGMIL